MQVHAIFARLGITAVLLSSITSHASVISTWDVTDAQFNIRVNATDYLVDTQGVFGEVGRKVQVSNLVGKLDTSAGPSQLKLDFEHQWGYDVYYYYLDVHYDFSYSVRDYETQEVLVSDTAKLKISDWSEIIPLQAGTPVGGSFIASTVGDAGADTSSFLQGFSVFEPFKGYPIYAKLWASGDYPDDFSLSYSAYDKWADNNPPGVSVGGLAMSFGQGFVREPAEPGTFPYFYSYTGTVSLTPAIPEPETYALMAMGLAGIAAARRFKSSNSHKSKRFSDA